MASRLPKIAPITIERGRVEAWLVSHARTSLRYLSAPAGSGKTTAAVLYARRRPDRLVFVSLEPACDEASFISLLCVSLGRSVVPTYRELVEVLADAVPVEIIVDDVDNAGARVREILARIYLDVPDGAVFIYLGRSEETLVVGNAQARGLVELGSAGLFSFDVSETARLAELLGAPSDPRSAAQLCEATHGWALAVCGTCRTAGEGSLHLPAALAEWRSRNERALQAVVADAVCVATPNVAAAFGEVLAGRKVLDEEELTIFARSGLFVVAHKGRLALNPLFCADAKAVPAITGDAAPAIVEMFGRFEMSINGKPIAWIRRRDRQIVAFLASRPCGRASRAEIIAVFWPEADRQLARQSLRTACSTIRRAIAALVGRENVGRYFVGNAVLELVIENALISSCMFQAHCELSTRAYERSDFGASFTHARSAELLYRSPFLAGEPPIFWALPHERRLAQLHAETAARIRELSAGRWTPANGSAPPNGSSGRKLTG